MSGLDEAWRDAVAALPDGYYLTMTRTIGGTVTAQARPPATRKRPAESVHSGPFSTPAAALDALTFRLAATPTPTTEEPNSITETPEDNR